MGVTHSTPSDVTFSATGRDAWDAGHTLDIDANAQTGTTYTVVVTDNGRVVTLNNTSPITVTVPSGLGEGFSCMFARLGAGSVTISAGSGVTINSRGALTALNGQYAVASLIPTAVANIYLLAGDLA